MSSEYDSTVNDADYGDSPEKLMENDDPDEDDDDDEDYDKSSPKVFNTNMDSFL